MRYVKPRTYRLNPRRDLPVLDSVVERFSKHRFSFTEPEALEALWTSGEEVRLREDTRFWEIADLGHFHLADHQLANGMLGDRLWQGLWDGREVERELQALDRQRGGSFHVFCAAEPIFKISDGAYRLAARARLGVPVEVAHQFEAAREVLLIEHLATGLLRTSQGMLEWLVRFAQQFEADHDALDLVEGWLDSQAEWTEVGRGLWLPTSLVPKPPEPARMRVRAIHLATSETTEDDPVANEDALPVEHRPELVPDDPPVTRDGDATVSWTQTLRAMHIQGGYVPVPSSARFRYPRFVGQAGPVAIRGLIHDTGSEGYLWLDRRRNILFGDLLTELIEWEEAGRRLHLRWAADALVFQFGDVDLEVQAEETRFIDPEALHTLRLELGESYRASVAEILKSSGPVPFRQLYEALVRRVGHRPSRNSIRSILSVCPEFRLRGRAWEWQPGSGSSRSLRRALVLSRLGLDPRDESVDIARLAEAALQRAGQIRAPTADESTD